jgi:RNA polymerase sigma factor (sigma-70 family)
LTRVDDARVRLFIEERDNLLAYVKRIAPIGCEGADILQEVGLRLLCRTDIDADRDHVTAWCKSVARHIVLHELRAARYERAKLSALDAASSPDAWESQTRAALRSTAARELERMDFASRDLVLRRYVLEQTSSEIARDIDLSAPAVRMRLMRIREEIETHAEKRHDAPSHEGDSAIDSIAPAGNDSD